MLRRAIALPPAGEEYVAAPLAARVARAGAQPIRADAIEVIHQGKDRPGGHRLPEELLFGGLAHDGSAVPRACPTAGRWAESPRHARHEDAVGLPVREDSY